ncbi:MAG: hypothetical protein IJ658_01340, partial [Kiritimatiellae bacterium]|nr:hypothetical protein [Kiritimatiellia bacterium]
MRRLFACMAAMGIAGGMVPSARAEDAYVDSDGTQAVVLDYFANPQTRVEADFAWLDLARQQRPFGESGAAAGLTCAVYISNGDEYAWGFQNGDGDWQWTGVKASLDRRTVIIDGLNRKVQVIKNGTVESTKTSVKATTQTAIYPLALFANCSNAAGTSFGSYGKVRFYAFRIYENEVLVRDIRPWKGGDGTCGMQDVLTGRVYLPAVGNPLAGGGDFACSDDTFTWTGAASANWNDAANWQTSSGTAAATPPGNLDRAVIAGPATVDIGALALAPATLTLAGGTVTLTGRTPRMLTAELAIDAGAT